VYSPCVKKLNAVAAVRDGLKGWETLKNRSLDIDLVLTEVDLPLISSFSLLTQIMDHHNCKNIPLISMSSQWKLEIDGRSTSVNQEVQKGRLH